MTLLLYPLILNEATEELVKEFDFKYQLRMKPVQINRFRPVYTLFLFILLFLLQLHWLSIQLTTVFKVVFFLKLLQGGRYQFNCFINMSH